MPLDAVDRSLLSSVIAVVSRPHAGRLDSFMLHAPLEVLARAVLLGRLGGADKAAARDQLGRVRDAYARALVPADVGDDSTMPPTVTIAERVIAAGNPTDARRIVAPLLLDTLAAAAHAPIFFTLLPVALEIGAPSRALELLRPLAHAVGDGTAPAITWHREAADKPVERHAGSGPLVTGPPHRVTSALEVLTQRLAEVPRVGPLDSDFVAPTMLAVQSAGVPQAVIGDLLDRLEPADVRLLAERVAALAMLQDNPAHAPYGWTHALTMAQAALSLADVVGGRDAVAVGLTHLVGFLSTLGTVRLDLTAVPSSPTDEGVDDLLVRRASAHEDAHLVKYVAACLLAGQRPGADPCLFRCAGAFLEQWWARHDERRADQRVNMP